MSREAFCYHPRMDSALKSAAATYADIEALPAHVTGQIVEGELFASPRPSPSHNQSASVLCFRIGAAFDQALDGPGGWVIRNEPELHLDDTVMVPDIAGWRVERWPGKITGNGIEVAPDWVCEVLSPSTEVFDRSRKLRAYARFGVGFAWLVDPVKHFVEVFERQGAFWVQKQVVVGRETLCAAPFDALTIPLVKLWLNPPPESASGAVEDE